MYIDRELTCFIVQVSSYINSEHSCLCFVFIHENLFQNAYFHWARQSAFDSKVQKSRSLHQGVQIQPKPSTPQPPIRLVMVSSPAGLIQGRKAKHLCLSTAEIKGEYSLTDINRVQSN